MATENQILGQVRTQQRASPSSWEDWIRHYDVIAPQTSQMQLMGSLICKALLWYAKS